MDITSISVVADSRYYWGRIEGTPVIIDTTDCWVNVTELCVRFSRDIDSWQKSCMARYGIIKFGSPHEVMRKADGIYARPDLAVHIYKWASGYRRVALDQFMELPGDESREEKYEVKLPTQDDIPPQA
jgi:hypothetical protein